MRNDVSPGDSLLPRVSSCPLDTSYCRRVSMFLLDDKRWRLRLEVAELNRSKGEKNKSNHLTCWEGESGGGACGGNQSLSAYVASDGCSSSSVFTGNRQQRRLHRNLSPLLHLQFLPFHSHPFPVPPPTSSVQDASRSRHRRSFLFRQVAAVCQFVRCFVQKLSHHNPSRSQAERRRTSTLRNHLNEWCEKKHEASDGPQECALFQSNRVS